MGTRSELDYILTRLKKEMMYDTFLCAMKLIADGETFVKKVSKAGLGGSGCIFVPKRYIGQQVRVMLTPLKSEVVEANQAVIDQQHKLLITNRKLRAAENKLKELKSGDTEKTDETALEPEEIKDIPVEDLTNTEEDDAY